MHICASLEVSGKRQNSPAGLPLGDQACQVFPSLLLFTHYLNLVRAWLKWFPETGSSHQTVEGGKEGKVRSLPSKPAKGPETEHQLCWVPLGKVLPPQTVGVSNTR